MDAVNVVLFRHSPRPSELKQPMENDESPRPSGYAARALVVGNQEAVEAQGCEGSVITA